MISQDVMFDEEREWDLNSSTDEFNFFLRFDEAEQTLVEQLGEPQQEHVTPPASPMQSDKGNSPPSFLAERNEERIRSLEDLYEVTDRLENLNLFCLFADCEPVNFQEAAQDGKWRNVMDDEIKAIEKNDT